MGDLETGEVALKETSPWLVFQSFKNRQWLANAVRLSLAFAPKCVLPSVLGIVAIGVWIASFFIMASRMNQVNDIGQLLFTLISSMAALLISGVMLIWGLTLWFARLTAVCAAALSLSETSWQTAIDADVLKTSVSTALAAVDQRKGFLTKYYLLIGLYILAPTVCFCICSGVVTCAHMMPSLNLPPWFEISAIVGAIGSSTYIFILSMISLVVSSSCKPLVQKSVYKTVGLSVTCFLPCLILSLVILPVLTILTEPLSPFIAAQPAVLNTQILVMFVVNFLWHSVVAVFALPFVVLPFCELLRGRFE